MYEISCYCQIIHVDFKRIFLLSATLILKIYIPFSLDEIISLEFYELDSSSMLEDFCLQDPSVSIVVKQGILLAFAWRIITCALPCIISRGQKIKCFDQWVTMSQINTRVCIN
jgi:hypothetical protein